MIAVTCRNGEHFSLDPDDIERVETVPDTVVHQHRLAGGVAEIAAQPAQLRIERRARSRDVPAAPPPSSAAPAGSDTDSDTD